MAPRAVRCGGGVGAVPPHSAIGPLGQRGLGCSGLLKSLRGLAGLRGGERDGPGAGAVPVVLPRPESGRKGLGAAPPVPVRGCTRPPHGFVTEGAASRRQLRWRGGKAARRHNLAWS